MQIFVIGSTHFEKADSEKLAEIGVQLGTALAPHDHVVVVGTDSEKTIDPHVVKGILEAEGAKAQIQVNRPNDGSQPYHELTSGKGSKIQTHYYPWIEWPVSHMNSVASSDAVVLIGGGKNTLTSGLAAHFLGKTVIPIGSLGGTARTVWEFASTHRAKFYHGALSDLEIDQLVSPWQGTKSAKNIVKLVEKVHKEAQLRRIGTKRIAVTIILGVAFSIAWMYLLAPPQPNDEPLFAWSLREWLAELGALRGYLTICAAGLFGASMRVLHDLYKGILISNGRIALQFALGLMAGVLSVLLYLATQTVATMGSEVALEWKQGQLVIGSLIAIFSALYLDAAFSRFDLMSERVIRGEFVETDDSKSE